MTFRGVAALAWAVPCLLIASSCTASTPQAPASPAERTQRSLDAVSQEVEDTLVMQAGGGWTREAPAVYMPCLTEDGTSGQQYYIEGRGLPSALAQDWDVAVAAARSAANAHGYTRESMTNASGTRWHSFTNDDGNTVGIELYQDPSTVSLTAFSECRTQW